MASLSSRKWASRQLSPHRELPHSSGEAHRRNTLVSLDREGIPVRQIVILAEISALFRRWVKLFESLNDSSPQCKLMPINHRSRWIIRVQSIGGVRQAQYVGKSWKLSTELAPSLRQGNYPGFPTVGRQEAEESIDTTGCDL